MDHLTEFEEAAEVTPRRLRYFNAGFLKQRRVRRIMELAGYDLRLGKPAEGDGVAVWGHSPYAGRGEAVSDATGAPLVRVEDAFLRSVHPGRDGEPPLGLIIDPVGMHFASEHPSGLERLLREHPLDDTALLNRARGGIARLRETRLSKYNNFDPDLQAPSPGYVLVIDQTRGDASVTQSRADANSFKEMLYWAQEDNPAARIVIKTHPETMAGHREGYLGTEDAISDRVTLLTDPVDPWSLLEGATGVYCVSSQMGFEAILMGHRPVVFGQPFYAGWGLTDDRHPLGFPGGRRGRKLTPAQMFACAMLLYPTWYHPCEDRICAFEDALDWLEARVRAWREDRHGWQAGGMRLWKRGVIQQVFGSETRVVFSDDPPEPPRRQMVWAGQAKKGDLVRVEDGFLRSRGLGANLVPPLSLACDDLGIYYDPTRESRLERMIAARATLRPDQEARTEDLVETLIRLGLTKYNLPGAVPALPSTGRRILVPGQVEDDASIRLGAGEITTNAGLLAFARAANPDAVILYKPHPDVEAGLRPGAVEQPEDWADVVLHRVDPGVLLEQVDEVWTMTSLIGFEALLRGRVVTVTGTPFYAGWGLTRDLGRVPARRAARPSMLGLAHAALIDYPRYFDPVTRQPCSVETAVLRLSEAAVDRGGPMLRLLSKAQGAMAGMSWLWR